MKFIEVLILCFFAHSALADVIVLKNGDRVTGNIKKIWDHEVFVDPDYSDEFSIDQDYIAYVESDKQFEMELDPTEGTVLATFGGADENGEQIIEVDGQRRILPFLEVEELEDLEDFFDWSSRVDLNVALNSGNTNNFDRAFSADLMFKWGRAKNFIDLLWQYEQQNDLTTEESVTVKDREYFRYNLNYELTEPYFAGAAASYEKDPFKGLEYRWNVLPAAGYNIWDAAGRLFNVQLGAGFQSEETFEDDPNIPGIQRENVLKQHGAIAQFILRFDYDFGAPSLRAYLNNSTTAAFYGRKNVVTQFSTGLNYEITDLLYLNLEFRSDYESQPVEGVQPEDLSILFGFGLEFDK